MDNGTIEFSIPDLSKSIMDSFKSTPLQGIIIIGTIVLLVVFSILFIVFTKRRRRRKQIRLAEQVFNETLQDIEISPEEYSLLNLIADNIAGGKEKKYLAVTDRKTFHRTVKKLIDSGRISQDEADSLESKLAFCCFLDLGPITGTDDLPVGTHIYILTEESQGFNGKLTAHQNGNLIVSIGRGKALKQKSGKAEVYLKRRDLHYTFPTEFRKISDTEISLAGPVPVTRVERRDYYRREVRLTAGIRKETSETGLMQTKLYDLSGGGATALNPDGKFVAGQLAVLTLQLPDMEPLSIHARIVRTSPDGKRLHLQFDGVSEAVRDKIIGFLLSSREE